MSTKAQTNEFAKLFRLYRLHSGIGTLKEFADLMEKEGVFYDASIYTRWQQGERMPTERKTLLGMINIFLKKETITRIEDINRFMNIAGQESLSDEEVSGLLNIIHQQVNIIPPDLPDFVGRSFLLKDINWHLLAYEIICIYGPPGTGKTSLVVHLAHLLRDHIKDGIFYYRADIQYPDTILTDIAKCFGEDISQIRKIEDKITYIESILKNKQVLIILDNIEIYRDIEVLANRLKFSCKFIFVSQHKPGFYENSCIFYIPSFSEEETIQLARHKLGGNYVEKNKAALIELARLTANSPLALNIIFSYVYTQKASIESVINTIDNWLLPLAYKTTHDNKTMASSLDLLINTIDQVSKDILYSFTMFDGKDVSVESLLSIHLISYDEGIKKIDNLVDMSLLDRGRNSRFQIHPLIKSYLSQRTIPTKWYTRLSNYFIHLDIIDDEIDNIRGVFRYLSEHKEYDTMISLWNHIAVFLFSRGRWDEIKEYKDKLDDFSKEDKLKNTIFYTLFTLFLFFGFFELFNSNLSYIFSYTYGLVALIGGVIGILIAKKWRFSSNTIGKAIIVFSLGLLAQEFGQISYTVIGFVTSQYKTPYPSIGDVGYFGSIPLYIYGLILLIRASGLKIGFKSMTNKLWILLTPLILLVFSYTIFLKGYIFNWSYPLTIFLDFVYPLGQSIYISLALMIYVLSKKTLGVVLSKGVVLILFALLLQYVADFIFLYQYSRNIWELGNFSDFLYLPAYGMMGIALLQFDYTYKLKQPNNTDLFTKVKKYIFSTT